MVTCIKKKNKTKKELDSGGPQGGGGHRQKLQLWIGCLGRPHRDRGCLSKSLQERSQSYSNENGVVLAPKSHRKMEQNTQRLKQIYMKI